MAKQESTNYPKSIENGNGESMTFVGREVVDGEERVLLEAVVQPGKGPPMHAHLRQTECLSVVSGELTYQIQGQEPRRLGPGESVSFAPGQPHRFWASSEEDLHCKGFVSPPDNVEYFLGKMYESIRDNDADGRPDDYDAAFLLKHFQREYAMPEIPGFVQKAVFPLLRGLGRLSGKHRRFQDAPAPVSR